MEENLLNMNTDAPSAAEAGAKALTVTKIDLIAALLSFIVALSYVELLVVHSPHWGYAAFTALYLAAVELYCIFKHRPRATGETRFLGTCLLAVAIARLLFHDRTVEGFDMLFLHGLACYYALARTGLLTEGKSGPLLLFDLVSALILLPCKNLFLRCRLFFAARAAKRRDDAPNARKTVYALLIALPAALLLFFAASAILSAADPFFAESVGRFFRLNLVLDHDSWIALPLSLPVGAYLFGLVGGAMQQGKPSFSAPAVRAAAQKARAVPVGIAAAVLTAFLLLYALFFAFQGSYLFGAMQGALPAGFTAAAYARQGFFELCEIVSLNFVLLIAVAGAAKTPLRESTLLRTLALLLLLCSLLFAVVAASKMALYITRFGITQRRLLASFSMLTLFSFTCLAIYGILRPFQIVRACLLLALGLFSLFCLSNPDARIVEINLAQYQSGAVTALDVAYLADDCRANEDPVRFCRQLQQAGYFSVPRTYADLAAAFGLENERQVQPDGASTSVWLGRDGASVVAAFDGTALCEITTVP